MFWRTQLSRIFSLLVCCRPAITSFITSFTCTQKEKYLDGSKWSDSNLPGLKNLKCVPWRSREESKLGSLVRKRFHPPVHKNKFYQLYIWCAKLIFCSEGRLEGHSFNHPSIIYETLLSVANFMEIELMMSCEQRTKFVLRGLHLWRTRPCAISFTKIDNLISNLIQVCGCNSKISEKLFNGLITLVPWG